LILALLLLLCLVLDARYSQAAANTVWIHEIRFGFLDHDTKYLWSGFSRESGHDINAELIFSPSYALWHGHIRPNLGVSLNDSGDTSKVYAGGVWQYLWRNGFIFDLGAGLALHDGDIASTDAPDKKQLGSRVLFHFALEFGYALSVHNRFFVMFDHISNGYMTEPSEGLDTIGIRYGYLF
jgi:hypothetical protein